MSAIIQIIEVITNVLTFTKGPFNLLNPLTCLIMDETRFAEDKCDFKIFYYLGSFVYYCWMTYQTGSMLS